uniref:Uncharacterized protein n=1 Tax=Vitis vinifera TaxID=29760 RepID=A5BVW9_VITVI|nr:hypothetical protein VITISV_019442 [Vitis vinifera]
MHDRCPNPQAWHTWWRALKEPRVASWLVVIETDGGIEERATGERNGNGDKNRGERVVHVKRRRRGFRAFETEQPRAKLVLLVRGRPTVSFKALCLRKFDYRIWMDLDVPCVEEQLQGFQISSLKDEDLERNRVAAKEDAHWRMTLSVARSLMTPSSTQRDVSWEVTVTKIVNNMNRLRPSPQRDLDSNAGTTMRPLTAAVTAAGGNASYQLLEGQLVAGQEDIRAADLSECWTGVALDQNGHLLPRTCEAAAERDLWTLFQAWKGKIKVASVDTSGDLVKLTLEPAASGEQSTLEADFVLVSAGVRAIDDEEEFPVQIQSSEVLLLLYKEETSTAVEITTKQVGSSVVSGSNAELLDFDSWFTRLLIHMATSGYL